VRLRCLTVAQVLLMSVASVLLFLGLHDSAVVIAAERGRTLRDGVGWGIAVYLATYIFALLVLLQNVVALYWPAKRVRSAILAWLVFAMALTALFNPFGSWAHPYRFMLLLLCAAIGFFLSWMGQSLWHLWRQRCLSDSPVG